MKTYGGVDVYIQVVFTSAPVGGQWWASLSRRFTSAKRDPGTHWIAGWVGAKTLSEVKSENYWLYRASSSMYFGCPARSPSLYRLYYPGFCSLEENVGTNLEIMGWCEMAEDWAHLWEFWNNIQYIYVPQNAGSFFASWLTISFR
jgi:hypothetical protein